MINAVFVIWRECFEAILIVSLITAYLRKRDDFARSRLYVALGVTIGLVLSLLLGLAIQKAETRLEGNHLSAFDITMLLVSALLMTKMCLWMNKHGHEVKGRLERDVEQSLTASRLIGVTVVVALAISREGAEVVIYLFGMGVNANGKEQVSLMFASMIASIIAAILAAAATMALQASARLFNPKWFFRATAIFLLLTAHTFVLAAMHRVLQAGFFPSLQSALWDTSFLVDDTSAVGHVLGSVTGYESAPAEALVLASAAFWLMTLTANYGDYRSLRAGVVAKFRTSVM
jgi:high-affinity iron transporter